MSSADHDWSSAALVSKLTRPFALGRDGGPGGWWILDQPLLELMGTEVQADLAGWHQDRHPRFPSERPVRVAPDWICEVLDGDSGCTDRTARAELYLLGGVSHYWLLDHRGRVLEALEAEDGRWIRQGAWTDGASVRVRPFEACVLAIGALFPPSSVR